jgi:xylulokinase
LYLGLDLGTSELKALLLADDHRIVGVARAPLTVERPQPLWSEQAPRQWWNALEEVMRALGKAHPEALAAVRGIGLSGQMHGAVFLDASTTPCCAPPSCGTMAAAHARVRRADARRCTRALHAIAGNLAMPGFTAPEVVVGAQARARPVRARRRSVLLPKDWLRLHAQRARQGLRALGRGRHAVAGCRRGATGPTNCWPPAA